jgi:hypothetical protein
MRLYATGSNAWNQLSFDSDPRPETVDTEPGDHYLFTKILEAADLQRPTAGLSYTMGTYLKTRENY